MSALNARFLQPPDRSWSSEGPAGGAHGAEQVENNPQSDGGQRALHDVQRALEDSQRDLGISRRALENSKHDLETHRRAINDSRRALASLNGDVASSRDTIRALQARMERDRAFLRGLADGINVFVRVWGAHIEEDDPREQTIEVDKQAFQEWHAFFQDRLPHLEQLTAQDGEQTGDVASASVSQPGAASGGGPQ
ncbi:hypothetical protein MBLNU459_g6714t1 [Dothideomycetes sp. NU459]